MTRGLSFGGDFMWRLSSNSFASASLFASSWASWNLGNYYVGDASSSHSLIFINFAFLNSSTSFLSASTWKLLLYSLIVCRLQMTFSHCFWLTVLGSVLLPPALQAAFWLHLHTHFCSTIHHCNPQNIETFYEKEKDLRIGKFSTQHFSAPVHVAFPKHADCFTPIQHQPFHGNIGSIVTSLWCNSSIPWCKYNGTGNSPRSSH